VTLVLDGDRFVLLGADLGETERVDDVYSARLLGGAVPLTGRETWASQLGAVGVLLDRAEARVRDASILQAGDGFVVTGMVPAAEHDAVSWVSMSREIPAAEIAAVVAGRAMSKRLVEPRSRERSASGTAFAAGREGRS
jgi:hypothetical protein